MTQSHCPNCKQTVTITESEYEKLACPYCGKNIKMPDAGGTIDWSPAQIDATIDMQGSPLDTASIDIHQTTIQQPKNGQTPDSQVTDHRAMETTEATVEHVPGAQSASTELSHIERTLEMFEDLWKAGGEPPISAFLPENENRRDILVELIHLDLSYRFKRGHVPHVETYLQMFPELMHERSVILELIVAEFSLRGKHDLKPDLGAFLKRFPQFADELAVLLKEAPRSRQRRFPIRLNCPHCHNAIAVVESQDAREMVCPSCHSSFRVDSRETQSWSPEALPMVDRFQLINMLGRGAFGTVYKARDTKLNRFVAMKIPRSGTFSSREDEDRFVSEAEHAAQLNHPGIVQVYDVGRTNEYPFIVIEFVRGVTLSDVTTARRMDFAEATRLIATIADALHHAHEHQVIHRDLKPANIMIDIDDNPRVMDFGLAKRHVGEITVTTDGSILGTPSYMSPEQASGNSQSADRRSDVYSLGVILFELLSGERPFRGNSVMLLHQVANTEAPRLRFLNDKIPLDLETIAAKCLEKDPGKRYQTAKELAEDLRRHLNHEPILARPIGPVERARRWCKRNPLLVKSASLVFATLTIALLIVSLSWRSEAIQRRRANKLADENHTLYEQEQLARQDAENAKVQALERLRDARRAVSSWLSVFPQMLEVPGLEHIVEKMQLQGAKDYERFAEQQSDDPRQELERGRSWMRLGEIRRQLGQDDDAYAAYEKAASVLTELLERDRDRIGPSKLAAEIANAQLGMGLVLRDIGRHQKAIDRVKQGISTLVAWESEDEPHLHEVLAASRLDLAVLQFQTGELTQAQESASLALSGYQKLCDRLSAQPSSQPPANYRLGLASAESLKAELLGQSGNYDDARDLLDRAINNLDELIASDPNNLEFLRERAEKRILLASVLRTLGDTIGELNAYDASEADYRELAHLRPGVPSIQSQLAICLVDKGNLLHHLQRSREAEAPLREAIANLEPLAQKIGRPEFHEQAAAARAMLGEVCRELGEYDLSVELLRSAATAYFQLYESAPTVVDYFERHATTVGQLGQTLAAMGQNEAAIDELQTAVTEFESLIASGSRRPAYLNAAAYSNWHLGEATLSTSPEMAQTALEQAGQYWSELESTAPSPEHFNAFAWFLVTCAKAECRDPMRALGLVNRALEVEPNNDRYLTTLGAAYYRLKEFDLCENTMRNLTSEPTANGAAQLWLAMALAEQGQSADARKHYDAGVAWITEQQPGNQMFQRLRQEASKAIEKLSTQTSK
ncbi:MAG: protein kinase [Planctomycetaceae bacterium]|nr:protein kinase [Planctomycetales bacterium]MCB9924281.1 protein kinase [Planctomycetaceae bacterium]